MIHGSTSDPVFITKISLRIWTLRDEVESIVESRLEAGDNSVNVQDLYDEYRLNDSENPDNVVSIEEGKKPENSTEESPEENTDEESSESDNNQQDGNIIILQRAPKIDSDKIAIGKTLISEIYMDTMYLFSSKPFTEGQSIVLDFMVPKRFIVNADVTYCRPYSMKSRIIGENKLPYRLAIKFTFLKQGERTLLRNFLTSVEVDKEKLKEEKKKKAEKSKDEFDELSELNF